MINNTITLTKCQDTAINSIREFIKSDKNIHILKGAAGTGKTTLIEFIIDEINSRGLTFSIMAPTGRAARVIGEKINTPASTIHKSRVIW